MSADERYMRMALAEAMPGRGRVEPNPLVGAVLARDGEVLGVGHHACYGGPHAEVAALDAAGEKARGADLYVTLEPCSHRGKTPPCTEAVIRAGVSRVVFAAVDPDPVTSGRGPRILAGAGVEVVGGLLEPEARALNRRFADQLGSDLPFAIAKWAMTLDGKIADVDGGSLYITGEESRVLVHEVRGAVDAIAVGVGTVLVDDPSLTVRAEGATRRPVRVVLDTHLRTPPAARVVAGTAVMPTWIVCGESAAPDAEEALAAAGCRILRAPEADGSVDLTAAFRRLRAEGLARILLEGGGRIHAAALEAGVIGQVMAFVAPILLGGANAPTPVDGEGLRRIGDALRLKDVRTAAMGPDILIEGFTT